MSEGGRAPRPVRGKGKNDASDKAPVHPVLRLELYLDGARLGDDEDDRTLSKLAHFTQAPDDTLTDAQLTELACRIYESRRLRSRFLSASLLGEPVWDMLLALFCFASRGEALSVSGLCQAAGVPQTTALRWAQTMEQKRLIVRRKDLKDGRRAYIALTEEAETLMRRYLATIHKALTGDGDR